MQTSVKSNHHRYAPAWVSSVRPIPPVSKRMLWHTRTFGLQQVPDNIADDETVPGRNLKTLLGRQEKVGFGLGMLNVAFADNSSVIGRQAERAQQLVDLGSMAGSRYTPGNIMSRRRRRSVAAPGRGSALGESSLMMVP